MYFRKIVLAICLERQFQPHKEQSSRVKSRGKETSQAELVEKSVKDDHSLTQSSGPDPENTDWRSFGEANFPEVGHVFDLLISGQEAKNLVTPRFLLEDVGVNAKKEGLRSREPEPSSAKQQLSFCGSHVCITVTEQSTHTGADCSGCRSEVLQNKMWTQQTLMCFSILKYNCWAVDRAVCIFGTN